ncbi:MAG: FxDxF family PEP-CTERM protein [Methylophilaceae bacterium]
MKIKQIVLGLTVVFASTSAMADVFNINVISDTTSFNHANVTSGAFSDTWNFNISGLVSADGILTNFASRADQNIDFTSATLNGVGLVIDNTGVFGLLSSAVLFPTNFTGPLQLIVNGTSGGNGSYSGNLNIAAVPEPETYALMLAGLGLIGFAARRNKVAA